MEALVMLSARHVACTPVSLWNLAIYSYFRYSLAMHTELCLRCSHMCGICSCPVVQGTQESFFHWSKSVCVILLHISLRYLVMCVSENILQVLTLIACIHMLICGLLMHSRVSALKNVRRRGCCFVFVGEKKQLCKLNFLLQVCECVFCTIVPCSAFNKKREKEFHFHTLLSMNSLCAFFHLKYEVFSGEVWDLGHKL